MHLITPILFKLNCLSEYGLTKQDTDQPIQKAQYDTMVTAKKEITDF